MDKLKAKYIVDVLMGISFILVFFTGVIKFPRLLGSIGIDIKSIPLREISMLHDWSGLAMGMLVFAHLALNWQWIVCMTRKYFGRHEKKC